MSKSMDAQDRRWCGHEARRHRFGVCIWCARAKHPGANFEPGHPFNPLPKAMLERQRTAAELMDMLFERPSEK